MHALVLLFLFSFDSVRLVDTVLLSVADFDVIM